MTTKVCSKCGEEKDIIEFHNDSSSKDGKCYYCKPCACKNARKNRVENKLKAELGEKKQILEKKCSKCNTIKPTSEFTKDSGSASGYNSWCKDCEYPAHREYWKSTKPIRNLKQREHYRENRESLCKSHAIWHHTYYKHTSKYRVTQSRNKHLRRTRENLVESTLTPLQWEKILESQSNKCSICGKRFCKSRPPTVDHIIPLSKGGGLTFENVQALCRSCNSSKNARLDHTKIITWCMS